MSEKKREYNKDTQIKEEEQYSTKQSRIHGLPLRQRTYWSIEGSVHMKYKAVYSVYYTRQHQSRAGGHGQ